MFKRLKRILIPIVISLMLFFILFMINQIAQFAERLDNSIAYGREFTWILFVAIIVLILYPVLQLLLLPRPLKRPKAEINVSGEELSRNEAKFYQKYKKRLLRIFGKYEKKFAISSELKKELINAGETDDIREVLYKIESVIDSEANKIVKKYANDVFICTAISQNSGLDAILLLKIQVEMVWEIAHLYNQKPHWKEMLEIYLNVFASGLMTIGISDIPIDEIVKKIVAKSMEQSIWAKLPGIDIASSISSLLADSLFEGTLNSLMTLRVGYITQDYCRYSDKFDKTKSVRSASKKAVKQSRTLAIEESALFRKLFMKEALKQKKKQPHFQIQKRKGCKKVRKYLIKIEKMRWETDYIDKFARIR